MTIHEYIESRKVEGSLKEKLESFSGDEVSAIEKLLERIKPNANSLRRILRLSSEICSRDSINVERLFSTKEFIEIQDGDAQGKEKAAHFRKKLEHLRYPEKAKLEARLLELQKSLISKYGLKIELPLELEGERLGVKISAKDATQLGEIAEKLRDLSVDTELLEIYSILSGDY